MRRSIASLRPPASKWTMLGFRPLNGCFRSGDWGCGTDDRSGRGVGGVGGVDGALGSTADEFAGATGGATGERGGGEVDGALGCMTGGCAAGGAGGVDGASGAIVEEVVGA